MKTGLAVFVAALVLTGCGSVGRAASPSPTPPSSPGFVYSVVVNEKDHNATLRVGQKLEVVLHADTGMTAWSQVRSSDTSVLMPIVNPAATAVRGVTLAAFLAVAPGEAEITAISGPDCGPGQACPAYVAIVTIKVIVTR